MKKLQVLIPALVALCSMTLVAQGPGGAAKGGGKGGAKGPPRPVLSVSSTSFPDGGEVPANNAFAGGNKSPQFTFHWTAANNPVAPPDGLQTYAIIFHDIENSTNRTTADTLHWTIFNIPGTTKELAEGLPGGDLPDGSRNGPGIAAGRGTPSYFGPGAGVGPFHHYVWEFYALDTKIDLPANTTLPELVKAMDGHVIGKAAYVGRYHQLPAAQ